MTGRELVLVYAGALVAALYAIALLLVAAIVTLEHRRRHPKPRPTTSPRPPAPAPTRVHRGPEVDLGPFPPIG